MANYWNHHRKHPALESIPAIHINRSGVADQFRRAVKAGKDIQPGIMGELKQTSLKSHRISGMTI